jgi:hypothetical protein
MLVIEPTKFEDVRTGEVSYGVRVYDEYEALYDNTWDNIPDSDSEVYEKVRENSDLAALIDAYLDSHLDSEKENDPVIMIGGVSYICEGDYIREFE